jgi:hypothetical protein
MSDTQALERAIEEQIAFLEAELARIRGGESASADTKYVRLSNDFMRPALTDPGFRSWLLARQLDTEVRR